jgi:hypothetical protein
MSERARKKMGVGKTYLSLEIVSESNGMHWVRYCKLFPAMVMLSFIVHIIILAWT